MSDLLERTAVFMGGRSLSGIVLCALILTPLEGALARPDGRPERAIRKAFQSHLRGR